MIFFLLLFPPFTLYWSSYGVLRCVVFSSGSPRKSIKYLYPLSYQSINCRYNFLLLKRRNLTCEFGLQLLKLRLLVVFIHRCDLLNEFRNVSSCVGGAIPLAWTRRGGGAAQFNLKSLQRLIDGLSSSSLRWNWQWQHIESILDYISITIPHAGRDEDGFQLEHTLGKYVCVVYRWRRRVNFQSAGVTSESIPTAAGKTNGRSVELQLDIS